MTPKGKTILRIAMVLLVLGLAAGYYGYEEYNRKNDSLKNAKPAFTLTSEELIKDFAANEKDANIKYLDKVILITGNIKSIDKDDKGFYTIALGENEAMSSVRCSIDSVDTPQAAPLQLSTTVAIKGICIGYNADELGIGSDVILNRCIISRK